jgi:hypothetical protein
LAGESTQSRPTPANQVRQAAKWLIAAFAAVGAALVATLQISGFGGVTGIRLVGAVAAAVMALLAVIVTIFKVSEVLDPKEATTTDLRQNQDLSRRLAADPSFIGGFGHPTVDSLIDDYERSFSAFRQAQIAAWARPDDDNAKAHLAESEGYFDALATIVDFFRQIVIYDQTKAAYRDAKRWVRVGAVLASVGFVGFAYAVNPSKSTGGCAGSKTSSTCVRGPEGPQGPPGRPGRRGPAGPRGPRGPRGESVVGED